MAPTGLIERSRLSDFDVDDFYSGNFIRVRSTEPNYTVDVDYTDWVADILKAAHLEVIGSDTQFLVVLEILDDLLCSGDSRIIIIDKLKAIRETLGLITMDRGSPSSTLVMRAISKVVDDKIADIRIDVL